ncbi:Rv1733c family protein [Streptomyces sp. NPDC001595]|uniref:Rv1733c family protein n=1 Tax=Streptomyces sp. NPDC001532 TaxID=3154520 RepID=UPI003332A27F
MGIRVRGWRWRHNPLRRRSDVVEAWTVLAVAVLLFLVAPLIGVGVAWWAHDEARETAAELRADRQRVRAEVVGRTADSLPVVQGGREYSYRVTVRWSDPEQGVRTAVARVPAGTEQGQTVEVWFDSRGRNVAPPPDGTAVWQHTLALGICAAGGSAGVTLLGHALVRRTATRHRMAEWERAWARTEPEWTRRDA